jgi:uncharacterized Ntn-hydrolase superfamily protein
MKQLLTFFISVLMLTGIKAQDTFSIVAVDSVTGEVGSAGASCVDLTNFPSLTTDFIGELFPNHGAANSQAFYVEANQERVRQRMLLGLEAPQVISYIIANDIQNMPELRQYGVATIKNGSPAAAAHTGSSTNSYTGDRVGTFYAIQGNILLGPEILDSMESRFLNAQGDLACKLMAAMQGANVVGADSRCAIYGTSSLFAFVKVAQPSDTFGNPSFLVSVRTAAGDSIEPIDSLQILFDSTHNCNPVNIKQDVVNDDIRIYPNPARDVIQVDLGKRSSSRIEIYDMMGKLIYAGEYHSKDAVNISGFSSRTLILKVIFDDTAYIRKVFRE